MEKNIITYDFRMISIICALCLFIAVFYWPIEYYRFLRVIVFIGAMAVIIKNNKNRLLWSILFVGVAILFNPIIPIYLYRRSIWMPLDIIVGILFLLELFLTKKKKNNDVPKSIEPKEQRTHHRDRIL